MDSCVYTFYEMNNCLQMFKDLLPYWQYKNALVNYSMQHIRNGLIIHLINSLKNNIC